MVRNLAFSIVCVVGGFALAACGGGNQSAPTPVQTPVVTTPTPTPSPTPKSSVTLPAGMVCPDPTPPPMLRMNVKIHAQEGSRIVLDSKPVVLNINGYCDKVGFGDWKFCDTRPEGNPERAACDYLATGISDATGRWGPTWYYGDELCGTDTETCANHPTEQFMAIAKKKGAYVACAADSVPVAPNGTHCGELEVE